MSRAMRGTIAAIVALLLTAGTAWGQDVRKRIVVKILKDIQEIQEEIAELNERLTTVEETIPIDFSLFVRQLCQDLAEQGLPPSEVCGPYLDFFPSKTVFLTSQSYTSNLGGLAGADAKCQQAADRSQVISGTYKAWLSSHVEDARDRMMKNPGPYRLPTGAVVAISWDDFVDGTHADGIDITEFGVQPSGGSTVWTATTPAGTLTPLAGTCGDWTDGGGFGGANVGLFHFQDASWTQASGVTCTSNKPLYCVEQ